MYVYVPLRKRRCNQSKAGLDWTRAQQLVRLLHPGETGEISTVLSQVRFHEPISPCSAGRGPSGLLRTPNPKFSFVHARRQRVNSVLLDLLVELFFFHLSAQVLISAHAKRGSLILSVAPISSSPALPPKPNAKKEIFFLSHCKIIGGSYIYQSKHNKSVNACRLSEQFYWYFLVGRKFLPTWALIGDENDQYAHGIGYFQYNWVNLYWKWQSVAVFPSGHPLSRDKSLGTISFQISLFSRLLMEMDCN